MADVTVTQSMTKTYTRLRLEHRENCWWPCKLTGLQCQACVHYAKNHRAATVSQNCSKSDTCLLSSQRYDRLSSHARTLTSTQRSVSTWSARGRAAMLGTNGQEEEKSWEGSALKGEKPRRERAAKCCRITAISTSKGRGWCCKNKTFPPQHVVSPPSSSWFLVFKILESSY